MIPSTAVAHSPDPWTRARRGLTYLQQELLAQERGEAPDLDRALAITRAVRGALLHAGARRAAELCADLRRYLEELREDTGGFSLEDLDITLGAVERMRLLLEDENAIDYWIEGVTPIGPARPLAAIDELVHAPEFRESGLYWELRDGSVQLRLPALACDADADRLIADLELLWNQLPREHAWTLRSGQLEQIRVSLLSTLVRLRQGEGTRPVQLQSIGGELQSPALSESLGRCFAVA